MVVPEHDTPLNRRSKELGRERQINDFFFFPWAHRGLVGLYTKALTIKCMASNVWLDRQARKT